MKLHYSLGGKDVSQRVDSLETASAVAVIVEDRHGATNSFPYLDDGKPACDQSKWLYHLEGARLMFELT